MIPSPNLKGLGLHLARPKSQRGELSETMPKRGKLARGRWWARWRIYTRQADGRETAKRAEKIIDRALAEQIGFALDYDGPLNKTDARKILENLIRESNARPAAFNAKVTFGELAREYIELNRPNWEASTSRVNVQIIEDHLVGKLGGRGVRDFANAESDLQHFLNTYVEKQCSKSLLSKLVTFLRAVFNLAVDKGLLERNPARKLRGKSKKRSSNLSHTLEECDRLLAHVSDADHLVVRILIQLGPRSEEVIALRRKDVLPHGLLIDEAIVDGETKGTKTLASTAVMYVPPDLELELRHYLQGLADGPDGWLFPSSRKGIAVRPGNFLNRVLKPAALLAGVSVRTSSKGKLTSALNYQSLRRTSSTLFGAKAKDPKSTQLHMRHADPTITLKVYQQAVPAEVKAAALALEADLLEQKRRREAENAEVRIV